jgi:hypothetical protein
MAIVELSQGHRGTRYGRRSRRPRIRPMRLDDAREGGVKPNLDTATSWSVRESDHPRGGSGP